MPTNSADELVQRKANFAKVHAKIQHYKIKELNNFTMTLNQFSAMVSNTTIFNCNFLKSNEINLI